MQGLLSGALTGLPPNPGSARVELGRGTAAVRVGLMILVSERWLSDCEDGEPLTSLYREEERPDSLTEAQSWVLQAGQHRCPAGLRQDSEGAQGLGLSSSESVGSAPWLGRTWARWLLLQGAVLRPLFALWGQKSCAPAMPRAQFPAGSSLSLG